MDRLDLISKKSLFSLLGVFGFAMFASAVRNHYLRLKKKMIKATPTQSSQLDDSAELECKAPKERIIPEDLFEKLVEKIKNTIIHNYCILIDKITESAGLYKEVQEKKVEVQDEGEIVVEDIKCDNQKEDLASITNEKADELREIISTMYTKTSFIPEFERRVFAHHNLNSKSISPYQILDYMVNTEKDIIRSFKYTVDEYRKSLAHYLKTNK